MSKMIPRGRVEHALIGDFSVPIPDVLQVTFHATNDFPREVHSVCRVPGESDVVFIGRAQDVAHEHWMRHDCARAVFIQCVYHLAPDARKLLDLDYWFNARSRMLHVIENKKASTDERIDAMFDLSCLHGWLEPPGLLN